MQISSASGFHFVGVRLPFRRRQASLSSASGFAFVDVSLSYSSVERLPYCRRQATLSSAVQFLSARSPSGSPIRVHQAFISSTQRFFAICTVKVSCSHRVSFYFLYISLIVTHFLCLAIVFSVSVFIAL
jgi:hypothetical protein